jgi:hypothetical protein
MDNPLYLFAKIVRASNEKSMTLKVNANVLFPMSLLCCDEFGTRDNAACPGTICTLSCRREDSFARSGVAAAQFLQ